MSKVALKVSFWACGVFYGALRVFISNRFQTARKIEGNRFHCAKSTRFEDNNQYVVLRNPSKILPVHGVEHIAGLHLLQNPATIRARVTDTCFATAANSHVQNVTIRDFFLAMANQSRDFRMQARLVFRGEILVGHIAAKSLGRVPFLVIIPPDTNNPVLSQ